MEKLINLRDLLVHEIQDLYSAEQQIIEALPKMVDKAGNKTLKSSLQDHLKVTERQVERLDKVKSLLGDENEEPAEGKKGFLSGLFGSKGHHCRGMEGLIKEGEKVMGEDMTPEVLDAAIIASAQKIEHYEICGYGTARAYARELNLGDVAELLEETLNEEYAADDLLTDLAVGRLNEEAEKGESGNGRTRRSSSRSSSASTGGRNGTASRNTARNGNGSPAKNAGGKNGRSGASKSARPAGKSTPARAAKKSAPAGRSKSVGGRKPASDRSKSTPTRGKSSSGKGRAAKRGR